LSLGTVTQLVGHLDQRGHDVVVGDGAVVLDVRLGGQLDGGLHVLEVVARAARARAGARAGARTCFEQIDNSDRR